ncbi:hypothetical protein C7S13_7694 [Burkholderia cepacia]|nr:hypothetical protein [Burkholderia cepacia]
MGGISSDEKLGRPILEFRGYSNSARIHARRLCFDSDNGFRVAYA